MKISIVVTTYNWESALACVLRSISRQIVLPYEVIVADDGSGEATAALIRTMAKDFPLILKHSWQEDIGYRVASSRNRGIAAAIGDYVIILDGDMMLNPHYVADHMHAAKPGFYVQGSRIMTTPDFDTDELLLKNRQPHFFTKGILKRRHTFRAPWLAKLRLKKTEGRKINGVASCNQGWWRQDLLALNGFDERFTGWGREDEDIQLRAYRMGLKRRDLRYAALATHVYHFKLDPTGIDPNEQWMHDNTRRNIIACELGLDNHLRDFLRNPLPDLRIQTQ